MIYNRLAHGIPLQLDSTVLYGLNKFGILASDKDLTSPSPYNTYKHKGLPPGPIDSPGAAAIQAVLHPAAGNWLYFLAWQERRDDVLPDAARARAPVHSEARPYGQTFGGEQYAEPKVCP